MTGRILIASAAVAGLLAPFAGSPYRADHASLDVTDIALTVASRQYQVTPIDLAEWIQSRKPGLQILDVGDGSYLLPGAEFVPMAALVASVSSLRPADPLVVYSADETTGAQAWVLLKALGFRQVFSLRGGMDGWLSDVLSPTISATATEEERRAFERIAQISRYFGGEPRVGESKSVEPGRGSSASPVPTAERLRALGRRGC
jgi:rhodanese-related sulfurtransferase